MPHSRETPYNALPLLPPGAEIETKAVFKQTIAAGRALAELKGSGDLIPNQSVLIGIIGLQEAKLSSEIENIVTTNDDLYRAFSDREEVAQHTANTQTKEILRYNEALWHGYRLLKEGRPLSTSLFVEIVQRIKQNTLGIRRDTGTWIVDGSHTVIYTPPQGESVIRDLLANLEEFLHDPLYDLDPLIKMAVLHYQFEAIHPFPDGNGRTGRILNILYLVYSGLLDIPVLYLSRYIIRNKRGYYAALRRVTEENDWEGWILYTLRGIEESAGETHQRIMAVRDLMAETADKVRTQLPKLYSKDLIELLFTQVYSKIRTLEESGIVKSRQTAAKHLSELVRIEVLKRVETGFGPGRGSYFINTRFLDLLTR